MAAGDGCVLYTRLKKNNDFKKLFTRGKKIFSPALIILYMPAKRTALGLCVSKKHGKSVRRNRIKRLLREAYRDRAEKLKPCAMLIIPRAAEEYSFHAFAKDLTRLFRKEKLVENRTEEDISAKLQISTKDGV